MPRRGQTPLVVNGPWGGLNERADARHIGDNQLAAMSNMVNRFGKIAPRPGFEESVATLAQAPTLLQAGQSFAVGGITVDTVNDLQPSKEHYLGYQKLGQGLFAQIVCSAAARRKPASRPG